LAKSRLRNGHKARIARRNAGHRGLVLARLTEAEIRQGFRATVAQLTQLSQQLEYTAAFILHTFPEQTKAFEAYVAQRQAEAEAKAAEEATKVEPAAPLSACRTCCDSKVLAYRSREGVEYSEACPDCVDLATAASVDALAAAAEAQQG
jgi:hypothetical protein